MWNRTPIPLLESAQAMLSCAKFWGILSLAAMPVLSFAQTPHSVSIERVSFLGDSPIRLQIQTSATLTPAVQMISSPERLVIDLPNSTPGRQLRGLKINRGEVRGVRTGLFSQVPPVTRIVVDLNTPQWYRVTPDATGFVISLGGEAQGAADAPATVGWVSTTTSTSKAKPQVSSVVARKTRIARPAPIVDPVVNGARVRFEDGKLSIHATNATLSEVLFQIQKVTGAEIAVPAGTEQQRVAGDFGPGSASEVLGDLLNGSGLNFVVIGSPTDPTQLRSVLLSKKEGEADAPSAFAQQDAGDSAANFDSDNSEPAAPVPQQAPPQQQLPPDSGPPADPPPTF